MESKPVSSQQQFQIINNTPSTSFVKMSTTSAPSNLPMMGVHTLDMEPATEATKVEAPLAFVKLEQLEAPLSSASAASSPDASSMTGLITTSQSRPVKKRRSWGQELPEPTTNLPPRKRAKTEAEKEQRRIERVKRNRQAAHNSRERKRQEHDALEVERNFLAEEKQGMRDRIKELEQQLAESQKIIAQLTGQKVQTTTTSIQQAPALLDAFSSPLVATESMFDPSQLSLLSSSTQHSSQSSTETTPILSNSSDFTSPSTASINTPSIHLINDFELTRQSAVLLCSDLLCRQLSMVLMMVSILEATSISLDRSLATPVSIGRCIMV